MKNKVLAGIIFCLFFLVFVAGSYYLYSKNRELEKTIGNLSKTNPINNTGQKDIIEKVSKLILLPAGEDPTVATVTDVEKLRGQKFFANAKNGDKILFYANAKKAILYDPVANKIIEVGPFIVPTSTPNLEPSPTLTQAISKTILLPTKTSTSTPTLKSPIISPTIY